jgi:hypothetical protein
MIPVRVPVDLKVTLATDRVFDMKPGHPLSHSQCPVCEEFLMNRRCVLVFAGIAPDDRKPAGFTTGAAVAVHEACAAGGPPAELPGWDDLSDKDKGAVLLHLHKREWEGPEYAESDYPCRYFDHPALTALTPAEACAHAASLGPAVAALMAANEDDEWYTRLYDAGLDADRARHAAGHAAGTDAP